MSGSRSMTDAQKRLDKEIQRVNRGLNTPDKQYERLERKDEARRKREAKKAAAASAAAGRANERADTATASGGADRAKGEKACVVL